MHTHRLGGDEAIALQEVCNLFAFSFFFSLRKATDRILPVSYLIQAGIPFEIVPVQPSTTIITATTTTTTPTTTTTITTTTAITTTITKNTTTLAATTITNTTINATAS
jgi:hypothetical protein